MFHFKIPPFNYSAIQPFLWAVIPLIVFAVYFPSLYFDFTGLDEKWLITNKLDLLKDLKNISVLFNSHTLSGYYRPFLMFTFMADTVTGGGDFFYYHLTNLVIHSCASIAFYFLVKETGLQQKHSLLLAILFALLPVHVHAVAWVPGRNDSILGLFTFLSVFFFLRYLKYNPINLAVSLLFFLFALFTKEGAVMIPAAFILMWHLKRENSSLKKIAIPLIICFVIGIIWYWFRSGIIEDGRGFRITSIPSILKDISLAFVIDISKIIFPVHPSVFPTVQDTPLLLPVLITSVVIVVLSFTGIRNKTLMLTGVSWFFLFHILSVVTGSTDGTFNHYEHRLYVPAAGLLLAFSQISFKKFTVHRRKLIYILFCLVCAGYILKIELRLPVYKNQQIFIQTATEESPHVPIFHSLLAEMYMEQKNDSAALSQYSIHLKLEPGRERTLTNRGYLYFKKGEHSKAIHDYTLAIQSSKNPGPIHAQRMLSYYYRKEFLKSMEDVLSAKHYGVNVNPKFIERTEKAMQKYFDYAKGDTALKILTGALAYHDRGRVLSNGSAIDLAFSDFNQAIALDSSYAEAYYSRAMLFSRISDYESALRDIEKAESLGYDVGVKMKETVRELMKSHPEKRGIRE